MGAQRHVMGGVQLTTVLIQCMRERERLVTQYTMSSPVNCESKHQQSSFFLTVCRGKQHDRMYIPLLYNNVLIMHS